MTVVFYDGVCGLCNRLVIFLLRRDRRGALRFATLQGNLARQSLPKHGLDPGDLDSVVVVVNWGLTSESAFTRSRAVLEALAEIGGGWRVLSGAARMVPRAVSDGIYRLI